MALAGWLARRILAIAIFPPLVGLWYGVFVYVVKLPPGFLGLGAQVFEELVIASIIAALITDFLIVRAVARWMKSREAPPSRR